MEESDEGLWTVECLRGRLLAERQASNTAKQDAELMGNKLMELEIELKEEIKLRNKAERRLKLLRKKLESLKLLPTLKELEHRAVSCASSTSSSSTKNPEKTASMSQKASDTTASIKSFEISFSKENSNSSGTTKSDTKDSSHENSSVKPSSGHEVPKVNDTSSSSLKAPRVEIDNEENENFEDGGGDDYVDNSLALVPLFLPETKLAPEMKIVSKRIGEVLETLRHAKERIQSSMERRQMIRVGPS
ncbi:Cyclin F-box [Hibiscus syriacus]|uniref:Cyclin F-box n=1 Tax=Hibiscus syriacus TaxID=106335 RepID=A0A6A3CMT2_HIBSY|nr:Cyclin F-box [Hibiscus syriacus]